MARRLSREDEIVMIARMHYEDRLPQNEVATRLGVSNSTVSRALKKALELGYVEIRVVPHAMRARGLEDRLKAKFGLQNAIVVEMRSSPEETLRTLGGAVAHFVEGRISEGMNIGVSDGRTVASVANGLHTAAYKKINVFPLIGGVGVRQLPSHPSEICRVMALNLGGDAWNLPVPAMADDARSAEVLRQTSSIRPIFEMMRRLDMAIMGIGALDDEAPIFRHGVITLKQMRSATEKGAIGTICARFFDADGTPVVTDLEPQTIAITLEDLAACPRRLLVANGAVKVPAIRGALLGGIVNLLGTDAETANALLEEPSARR
ncbi:sugar-binding transcriptional regulator [Pelagibacterium montanilacus]|uniref:sugar-binding transcriptional regulator n=1 Tax=Pelagibacterium montanilacus TaxID=2185280 RepID=UPI0013DFBD64|nr:sugar-binding transcriptional regulator [Pelagibacterium montanilacus]